MTEDHLKKSFEIRKKLQPFYTGGSLCISPDNKYLFCICETYAKVVSILTGEAIRTFGNEEDTIITVAGNNCILFTAHRASHLINQWDYLNERCDPIRSYKAHDHVPVASFALDNQSHTLLASGSTSGIIRVWDTENGYCTHQFKGSRGVVTLLVFHPKRLHLFSSSDDLQIRVWSLEESSLLMTLNSHVSPVTGIVFLRDDTMVSAGRDKVLNQWDLDEGRVKVTLPVFETLEGLAVINDLVVTCGDKGILRKWDFKKQSCVGEQEPLPLKREYVQIMNFEQSKMIAVTFDQNVMIFDNNFKLEKNLIGFNDEIIDVKRGFGDHVVMATNSEQIRLVHKDTLATTILTGHTSTILAVDTTCDGEILASASKDHTLRVWARAGNTYEEVATCTGHTAAVTGVALARLPQNSFMVSISSDLTLKMWQLNQKKMNKSRCVYTVKAHEKDLNCVAVSPNDKYIGTGSLDKTAKIWLSDKGVLCGVLRGHRRGIWSIRFSPADQCVLTCSGDALLKLWKLSDFSCIRTYEGHSASVLNAQFMSGGRQVVSSCSDGLIKVWDTVSAEAITTLDGHTDKCWAILVQEGEVVSGAADSLLNFWRDTTAEVQEKEIEEERVSSENQQNLRNLVHKEEYGAAFRLSLALEMPYRCLTIAEKLLGRPNAGASELGMICDELDQTELETLLSYISTWNTNSKHTVVAQGVLHSLISGAQFSRLSQYPKLRPHLEALLPYTERHFERLTQLHKMSTFIQYTWEQMKLSEL